MVKIWSNFNPDVAKNVNTQYKYALDHISWILQISELTGHSVKIWNISYKGSKETVERVKTWPFYGLNMGLTWSTNLVIPES